MQYYLHIEVVSLSCLNTCVSLIHNALSWNGAPRCNGFQYEDVMVQYKLCEFATFQSTGFSVGLLKWLFNFLVQYVLSMMLLFTFADLTQIVSVLSSTTRAVKWQDDHEPGCRFTEVQELISRYKTCQFMSYFIPQMLS